MGDENPSVLVIDDDPGFRDSVARLLRTIGLHARQFSSVPAFLEADPPEGPSCLVLDVRMPGRSGLELQRDLAAANRQVPIIFITAPFRDQDLLDAVWLRSGNVSTRSAPESVKSCPTLWPVA
jgi:CheY-like chemotaxis protein